MADSTQEHGHTRSANDLRSEVQADPTAFVDMNKTMVGIESRYAEKLPLEQFNSSKMWREKLRVKERENKRKRLMEVSSLKIFPLRYSLYIILKSKKKYYTKLYWFTYRKTTTFPRLQYWRTM